MTRPLARRQRHAPVQELEDVPRHLAWVLLDVEVPADATEVEKTLAFTVSDERLRPLWERHREALLAAWIRRAPGTRPACWWHFDAPRITTPPPMYGNWILRVAIQPRLRVAGTGVLLGAHGACTDHAYGIELGDWRHFDPTDPPKYESESAYLRRFKLFARGEAARLTAADFRPEVLPLDLWPDADAPEPAPH